MSNRAESRALARTALTLTVCGLLAFLLFSTGPTSATLAQTASPSATPTQTGPTTFSIQFLNPSGFSEEISAKDEGGGDEAANTYHLVAWVNALPSDASVEFRYKINGQSEEVLIGEGTAVAPGDTFEFMWAPPAEIPEAGSEEDNTFSLSAVLYSGGTEVARDTERDIFMNNQSPPADDEDQGSTVEITYPVNGGEAGFFERQDRPTQATIDTQRSSASRGFNTSEVGIFYTISSPGTEPEWNLCGAERGGGAQQTRCSLATTHELEEVTAIASRATDYACEPVLGVCAFDDDSGDAHRVLSYEQDPTALAIVPEQQNERPITTTGPPPQNTVTQGACSAIITATLTDQEGRFIPNAPIDVHAVGPTDELRFDDSGNNSSTVGNPQGHSREETMDCEASPPVQSSGSSATFQGDHNDPAGNDVKHIESTLGGGTGDTGTFAFQLYSPDRGETQMTVFVDNEIEDDQFCSFELSASASIGWAVPAPQPDGPDAEIAECAEPTPSPTSSRTPSATPSESPTEDPRGCTIVGTDDSEALEGTPGSDVICAGDGNDLIRGLGGNDTIYGEGGADEVRGGGGNDYVEGGDGKDTIRVAAGNDQALGGGQNDVITGGGGFDRLTGGTGFDTLRGGGGADNLNGGSGDDTLRGGSANDALFGKGGRDILVGDKGKDRCRGGAGKDRLKSC